MFFENFRGFKWGKHFIIEYSLTFIILHIVNEEKITNFTFLINFEIKIFIFYDENYESNLLDVI